MERTAAEAIAKFGPRDTEAIYCAFEAASAAIVRSEKMQPGDRELMALCVLDVWESGERDRNVIVRRSVVLFRARRAVGARSELGYPNALASPVR